MYLCVQVHTHTDPTHTLYSIRSHQPCNPHYSPFKACLTLGWQHPAYPIEYSLDRLISEVSATTVLKLAENVSHRAVFWGSQWLVFAVDEVKTQQDLGITIAITFFQLSCCPPVGTQSMIGCTWYILGTYQYIPSMKYVCTFMYLYMLYMHCNQTSLYLYSRVCLYRRSSDGVNCFCSSSQSSVMDGRKQPPLCHCVSLLDLP